MATHSSILAWRIRMDRGAWRVDPREGQGWRERDSPGAICMQNIESVLREGMVIKAPKLDNKSLPRSAIGH